MPELPDMSSLPLHQIVKEDKIESEKIDEIDEFQDLMQEQTMATETTQRNSNRRSGREIMLATEPKQKARKSLILASSSDEDE